jgi:ribosomal protein S18 acetylase RimI-like enzyme
MHIRRVRSDEASIRRFDEELWLPYQRSLEESVETHVMADEVDGDEIVEFHTDWFDDPGKRIWVALDDVDDPSGSLAELDATFAGFLTTSLRTPPSKFDGPDKLGLGNVYVDPAYRGTGVADDLVARAVQQAREDGAAEFVLDVDVDNDRALAYYEKLGFEVSKYTMRVPVEEVQLDT